MDGAVLICDNRTSLIDGLSNNVDDSAKSLRTNWHHDGVSSVADWLATNETFSGVQGDGTYVVTTQVLCNLENKTVLSALNFESIENGRKLTFELHVDDGTNNLRNLSMSDLCAEATYTTQFVK